MFVASDRVLVTTNATFHHSDRCTGEKNVVLDSICCRNGKNLTIAVNGSVSPKILCDDKVE